MNIKTVGISAAIITAVFTGPAFAQYERVPAPGYYGPAYGYYGPVYGPRIYRRAYNYYPVLPFYGDGWVPESIWDQSRVGSVDPTIRPSN